MIKKISEYLSVIIDKLYFNKSTESFHSKTNIDSKLATSSSSDSFTYSSNTVYASSINIELIDTEAKIIKTIDFLGREVGLSSGLMINLFDNGTYQKCFIY